MYNPRNLLLSLGGVGTELLDGMGETPTGIDTEHCIYHLSCYLSAYVQLTKTQEQVQIGLWLLYKTALGGPTDKVARKHIDIKFET